MPQGRWRAFGWLWAALGVALGAFGAHALTGTLDARSLVIYETGVRYHLFAALCVLLAAQDAGASHRPASLRLLVAGTVLFSSSLYALALSGVRLWGAVTPVGGILMVLGLGMLARDAVRGSDL